MPVDTNAVATVPVDANAVVATNDVAALPPAEPVATADRQRRLLRNARSGGGFPGERSVSSA